MDTDMPEVISSQINIRIYKVMLSELIIKTVVVKSKYRTF